MLNTLTNTLSREYMSNMSSIKIYKATPMLKIRGPQSPPRCLWGQGFLYIILVLHPSPKVNASRRCSGRVVGRDEPLCPLCPYQWSPWVGGKLAALFNFPSQNIYILAARKQASQLGLRSSFAKTVPRPGKRGKTGYSLEQ